MREIRKIVVHCAATPCNRDVKGENIVAGHLLPVSKGGRGWKAPGYHYIVELGGRIFASWPEDKISNGAKGHNRDSIHVCYIGGLSATGRPADTRTPAQKESLLRILRELRRRYPRAVILGHRDLSPDKNGDGQISPDEWVKACPSFSARKEYSGL